MFGSRLSVIRQVLPHGYPQQMKANTSKVQVKSNSILRSILKQIQPGPDLIRCEVRYSPMGLKWIDHKSVVLQRDYFGRNSGIFSHSIQ
jgi:hypothetical protein